MTAISLPVPPLRPVDPHADPSASLAEILRAGVATGRLLPLGVAIAIVRGACAAVDDLHALGLAHGALSAASVVVGPDGVARVAPPSPDEALPPAARAYAAPERLVGVGAAFAGDVYSIGAIAWEALARRRMPRHVAGPPPRLSEMAPHLGDVFDELIAKALSASPRFRLAGIADLGSALDRIARRHGGQASRQAVIAYLDVLSAEIVRRRRERAGLPVGRPTPLPDGEGAVEPATPARPELDPIHDAARTAPAVAAPLAAAGPAEPALAPVASPDAITEAAHAVRGRPPSGEARPAGLLTGLAIGSAVALVALGLRAATAPIEPAPAPALVDWRAPLSGSPASAESRSPRPAAIERRLTAAGSPAPRAQPIPTASEVRRAAPARPAPRNATTAPRVTPPARPAQAAPAPARMAQADILPPNPYGP